MTVVISAVLAPSVLRQRNGGRSRSVAAGIVWATAVLILGLTHDAIRVGTNVMLEMARSLIDNVAAIGAIGLLSVLLAYYFLRDGTNIHPASVLLAIPAGSAVAGILGIFLVVPVIAVEAATWRTILPIVGAEPAAAD